MCQKGLEQQGPRWAQGLPRSCRYINSCRIPGRQCPHAFTARVVHRKAAPRLQGDQASEFLLNHSTA